MVDRRWPVYVRRRRSSARFPEQGPGRGRVAVPARDVVRPCVVWGTTAFFLFWFVLYFEDG